ncbi:hydroxyacylglutathione hydrolase [Marivita sp. XM-24bin2]|uniref:hydroxyacylglutathione hydrolase n=1 Tax=unclassified Marivita TaxID=2632480 RepID=UPI000D799B23|nr:hydroxyacylglutathione hydrolase [Marivita sp. XM-24bin2]MCR9109049.1 hydroxyacylglutathione hydrolase [Paracoccaceae bacterium]PWL36962.1 MAG: hydroxyacylglutathione hydrolase [Marivita sp. XM-24bin2]
MPLELVTLPALSDNYTYLLHDSDSGATACIDVPEAQPILDELDKRGWTLTEIWLTHHHHDHIGGVDDLLAHYDAKVTGAAADRHRLPTLNREVSDGDAFEFGGEVVDILDVSGHTLGHIAFVVPGSGYAFTADSLMALGCGRLFEGTAAQMWESLQKLAALHPETLICSGHEYTQANARFAITIDPNNPDLKDRIESIDSKRSRNEPTVPSKLSEEAATNPFLRAADPAIMAHLDMIGADPVDVFAEIRARKDRF